MHFSKYFNKNNEYIIFSTFNLLSYPGKGKKKKSFFPVKVLKTIRNPIQSPKRKYPSPAAFFSQPKGRLLVFLFLFFN